MHINVVNKDEFIRKLKEDIPLSNSEINHISTNWDWYVTAAGTILPKIPKIGFFTSKQQKLLTYDKTVKLIYEYRLRDAKKIDKLKVLGEVILYSSKSYSRAIDAHENALVDSEFHPNTSHIKNTLIIMASFIFWAALMEFSNSLVTNLYDYYQREYEGVASGVILMSKLKRGKGVRYNISYSYIANHCCPVNFHSMTI